MSIEKNKGIETNNNLGFNEQLQNLSEYIYNNNDNNNINKYPIREEFAKNDLLKNSDNNDKLSQLFQKILPVDKIA